MAPRFHPLLRGAWGADGDPVIQVTLLDGLKRLLNPAMIQEIGTYTCDERGFAVPVGTDGAALRTFVLMTGGHDPIDVVETPDEVATLSAAWRAQAEYAPPRPALYAHRDEDGDMSFRLIAE
ncbi:hypothetical protein PAPPERLAPAPP_00600 [Brevundimonas phage vB_BpoS-Papperlapapp]|uniref:Uncharacterized protein n=1 Tax=Brevundimonas phage vB_BpoS-Domovoi TaxID=2948598 RepID=A0A9E7MRY5_9CAUD|nr:hypothetical protein DOMOVOI_05370 [Brevundimonas phage vB_BpoS-Domovoi]USN15802.1 hypothetical protein PAPPERLAPAPP_00600 [Brevundimonas phage vB_BpoS-Papperlapapp]